MFSGSILYLVYQLGARNAHECGVKLNSWRTIALILGFVVCLAMFGTDSPERGLVLEFGTESTSVFLGIFLVVVAAYILGYAGSRRRSPAERSKVSQPDLPTAQP